MPTITYEEYQSATRSYTGWCTHCQDFTRDCTEPDADDYDCPECEQDTVVGAELACIRGEFEVEGENDPDEGPEWDDHLSDF